jgi:MYXO-CTERM domain-containing protein
MRSIVLAACGLCVSAPAFAAINPFTETFSSPAANWSSASTFTALNYVGSGGPDGSGYGSASVTITSASSGTPIVFRGQDNFNSSSGALFGPYPTAGITTLTYSVRHNAPVPVQFFGRFLGSGAFTGAAYTNTFVQPNTWTTLSIPVSNYADANWTAEGAPSLIPATFANLARIQFGYFADAGTGANAGSYTFDIDNVSITPAPGAAALLGLGGLAVARRRRR